MSTAEQPWDSVSLLRDWIATLRPIFARLATKHADAVVCRQRNQLSVDNTTVELGPQPATALRSRIDGDVVLEIAQSEVLHAEIALPKASRNTLRKALRYEIGGLSPLGPDEVYYDFSARQNGHGQSVVDIRIVSRALVDATVALCQAANLKVGEIRLAGMAVDWREFPVDRVAYLRLIWRRHTLAILSLLNLALMCLVLAGAYSRVESQTAAILNQMQAAQSQAQQVETMSARIAAARASQRFFVAQQNGPALIAVLADLSEILPQGTWLERLELHGSKIELAGRSRSATGLLAILERSGRFANAKFIAPVTRQSDDVERFELSAEAIPHG